MLSNFYLYSVTHTHTPEKGEKAAFDICLNSNLFFDFVATVANAETNLIH